MYLEIACFNAESALVAEKAGADRIELCSGLEFGGLTPELDQVQYVMSNVHLPVFVMIRPRGGDFFYTNPEFEQMKASIILLKSKGVSGFVFGILDENQQVDIVRNSELVQLAVPSSCTFHRAFDRTPEANFALAGVMNCGFQTILTSGHAQDAMQGANHLKKLIEVASGKIEIMPGGGVRSDNISFLIKMTGARYFHSSALLKGETIADESEIKILKKLLSTHD